MEMFNGTVFDNYLTEMLTEMFNIHLSEPFAIHLHQLRSFLYNSIDVKYFY